MENRIKIFEEKLKYQIETSNDEILVLKNYLFNLNSNILNLKEKLKIFLK